MYDGRGTFVSWPRQARSAAPVKIVTGRSFPPLNSVQPTRLQLALLDPQVARELGIVALWGACPRTTCDPYHGVETGP